MRERRTYQRYQLTNAKFDAVYLDVITHGDQAFTMLPLAAVEKVLTDLGYEETDRPLTEPVEFGSV